MKLRVAILGYGRSGASMHAGAIEANAEHFELVAACDVDPERLKLAQERFGCAVHEDYHAMLAQENLDLVSVVTRSDQHCAMTCDCLAAGANVLVTKPWAVNAEEAGRMVATAERTGRMLLPWLPARWGPDLQRLRQLLDEGTIGRVFLVRRAVCSFGTRCDWQTERRYGGGYLLNWGPHIVDPPLVLLGSKVASAYGRLKQTINPGDVEDIFFGLLTLADGILVQVEYSIALEDLPSWVIQGDRGTIVMRNDQLKVYRKTPDRPDDPTNFASMKAGDEEVLEETVAGSRYGDQDQVYAEAAEALRGERPFAVTPGDALELSRVLDAIRLSDAENRIVTL